MVFDTDGYLLVESPAGSGSLVRVQGPLVTQPANAHAIVTEAYNRALIAYSDLKTPKAPINVYGLSTQQLDPYGQKPLGAAWLASTAYLVGEYVQPTVTGGNGHLYRCIARRHHQRHRAILAAYRKRHGYRWRRNLARADPSAGEPASRTEQPAAHPGRQRGSLRRRPRCLPGNDLRQRPGRVDRFRSRHPGQYKSARCRAVHRARLVQPGRMDTRPGIGLPTGIRQCVRSRRRHRGGGSLLSKLCPGGKFRPRGNRHSHGDSIRRRRRHPRTPPGSLQVDCSPRRRPP